MGIITGVIAGSIAGLIGVTIKQTKGLVEYLTAEGATSESKAISLSKEVADKYRLAQPLFSGNKIKKTKDKKYWVA